MEQSAAAEHAQSVAREAVRSGLTDADTVKVLFQDYNRFLQANVRGTFTQLLLARGAIDQAGFNLLQERVPPEVDESGSGFHARQPPSAARKSSGMVQTWALPSWKDGRSPDDSSSDSKRWGQATAGQSGVVSVPAQVGPGSGSFVSPPEGSETGSGLHPGPGTQSSGLHAAPRTHGSGFHPKPPPPAPPPAPAPGEGRLDDPLARSDSDSGSGAGTSSGSGSGAAEATQQKPSDDLDLTLNYENVIPTPLDRPPSGQVPVLQVDSGEVPGLGEDRHQLTMSPEYSPSDSGSVDSTAGDSSSQVPTSVSDSVPALDLVSDDQEKQEDAFFSIDSISDEDGADPNREPQLGEVMGDYQLLDILGRGGMGVIYRAQKLGTDQVFALKTLNVGSGTASTKRRARFQREVDALRRLKHENIIKVHTCGRKGQWDWYVMDLIEGRELKQALRDEDLKPYEKLSIFIDICKAVQHAHDHNVIHRDLKPANVLLSNDGNAVFVLDFGLAKLSDEDLGLTKTGAALGTPYYMAPEQIVNPKDVDYRVDVFSLGVMLYEMMVGQRPFTGDTAGEVSNKIMNEDPARPSLVNDKLYPSMDAICLKAMEKDPITRYQSVDELRREVAKYRRGAQVRNAAAVTQVWEQAKRYLNRNQQPVLIGVLLASLIYIPIILALLGLR